MLLRVTGWWPQYGHRAHLVSTSHFRINWSRERDCYNLAQGHTVICTSSQEPRDSSLRHAASFPRFSFTFKVCEVWRGELLSAQKRLKKMMRTSQVVILILPVGLWFVPRLDLLVFKILTLKRKKVGLFTAVRGKDLNFWNDSMKPKQFIKKHEFATFLKISLDFKCVEVSQISACPIRELQFTYYNF